VIETRQRVGSSVMTGLAILVTAILVAACGDSGPTATPSPVAVVSASPTTSSSPGASDSPPPSTSASPTPIPTATPAPTPLLVADPLTGRLVTPAIAKRHPIAVMIDDLSAARPQSGLASASIVWQAPAEGGIPRYMAIFQDDLPTDVGPVRSSRYYYIAWATEWKAVYVHAGGSPQALDTLKAKGHGQYVYDINGLRDSGTFRRIHTRFAPHNLYTTGPQLRHRGQQIGAKDKTYTPVWQFNGPAPLEARPYGGTIQVKYLANTITYKYDRTTNRYLRTVTGEKKETDASDKRRIAPTNVVVMVMSFGPLNDGHPDKHRLEAKVIGSGTAWVSTNGVTVKGTWKKTSITAPTQFFDKDGNQIPLTVGQTFVQVMPKGSFIAFKKGSLTPPVTE
jgi:Protein of unknown function (DUF3048) N-terminal domain/Protein of unknown function (DUF3048) C-terminal domain